MVYRIKRTDEVTKGQARSSTSIQRPREVPQEKMLKEIKYPCSYVLDQCTIKMLEIKYLHFISILKKLNTITFSENTER